MVGEGLCKGLCQCLVFFSVCITMNSKPGNSLSTTI